MSEQLKGSLQLAVADLDTTEAFYGGILELPVSRALTAWGGPEHLVMMVGGWELIFVNEAAVARTHPLLQGRLDVFPKGVGMTLHFRVTEIEDIADAIEEEAMLRAHPDLEERLDIFPKGVGMTLHFRVTEIEDIADAIEEEGLEILYPLDVKPYRMKELWCFDPDGYLVMLEEPVR